MRIQSVRPVMSIESMSGELPEFLTEINLVVPVLIGVFNSKANGVTAIKACAVHRASERMKNHPEKS